MLWEPVGGATAPPQKSTRNPLFTPKVVWLVMKYAEVFYPYRKRYTVAVKITYSGKAEFRTTYLITFKTSPNRRPTDFLEELSGKLQPLKLADETSVSRVGQIVLDLAANVDLVPCNKRASADYLSIYP